MTWKHKQGIALGVLNFKHYNIKEEACWDKEIKKKNNLENLHLICNLRHSKD